MRKNLLFFVLLFLSVSSLSQELTVQSFQLKTTDIDAKVNPVYDLNGNACALVKVAIIGNDVKFEGNIVSVKPGQGEYLVYMPAGSRRLKVISQGYLPLSVEFSEYLTGKIEKNLTYELRVLTPKQQSVIPVIDRQFLLMTVFPQDATVFIDEIPYSVNGGKVSADLVCGTHKYRVEKPMFKTEEGSFVLNPEAKTEIEVSLKENSGFVSFTSKPVDGAKVYIDDNYVGDTPCVSERLACGEHSIRIISNGYYVYSDTVSVMAGQTIDLPVELKASFAIVELVADADEDMLSVDGESVGKGKWNSVLNPGRHIVAVWRDGFVTYEEVFEVFENESRIINLPALVPIYGILSVTSTPIGTKVYEQDKYWGETPLRTNMMPVGTHTLTFSKDGYKSQTMTIKVTEVEPLDIVVEMKKGKSAAAPVEVAKKPVVVEPQRLPKEKGSLLLGVNVGFMPTVNFGATVAYAKKVGVYAKFSGNFKSANPAYECTSDGKIVGGGYIWTNGETLKSTMNFTAGAMFRVARPLYIMAGLGYGSTQLLWGDTDGNWATVTDCSYKGLAVNAGLQFKFAKFGIYAGTTITAFKEAGFDLGLGFWL